METLQILKRIYRSSSSCNVLPPNVPVYTPTGAFSGLPIDVAGGYGDMINPVAYLKRISIRNPTHEILINPYAEVTLAKI